MLRDKEWLFIRMETPSQIVSFIDEVFEVMEIRRRLGKENGIEFIVHSNEKNHARPHIHAKYGEYEISIAIDDQEVLAGNLPKKNTKIAQNWVKTHKNELMEEWNSFAISAISHTTKSRLSSR